MSNPRHIPYKARPAMMLFVILFFGACAAILAARALGDDPNSLRSLRRFDPETARLILWVLVVASVGFVATGVFALTRSSEIVIGEGAVRAPKSPVRSSMVAVKLSEIEDMKITTAARQRFLRLEHPGGRLSIVENALPKGMKAEDLAAVIEDARRTDGEAMP